MGGSAVLVGGVEGSIGGYIILGDWDTFDFGIIGSFGYGFGINVSSDFMVGTVIATDYTMLEGTMTNGNVFIGPLSVTGSFIPNGKETFDNPPQSLQIGHSAPLHGAGWSITTSHTYTFGRQKMIQGISDFMCWVTGDC